MSQYKSYYSGHSRSQSQAIRNASNKMSDICLYIYLSIIGLFVGFVIWKIYFPEKKKAGKRRGWTYLAEHEEALSERIELMSSLLIGKGWTESDVENLSLWNVINRDAEGWIDTENSGLNLKGENFLSMDSLVLDLRTGEFEIYMTECPEDNCGYFNMEDVTEILTRGITECQFSLDQVDTKVRYHPFQLINFGPSQIKSTNYLKSLLHADYLMKMMGQGTEVCARHPFCFKDGYEGFLQLLPGYLQKKVFPHYKDGDGAFRFWIESDEMSYTTQMTENGKIEFTFGHCPMVVKCHRLSYDANGKLVDDLEDSGESGTDAARFAKAFTKYYDDIGDYFPIFLRLRQLATISAISKILTSIVLETSNSEFLKDNGWSYAWPFGPLERTLRARGIYVGLPLDLSYHEHGEECAWVASAATGLTRVSSTMTRHSLAMYGGVRLGCRMNRVKSLPKRFSKSWTRSTSSRKSGSTSGGGGGGGSGGSDGEDLQKPKKKMNKNCKDYQGQTHVYRLYPKFGLPRDGKLGISSRGVRKSDGKSLRAEQQCRKLFKQTGVEHESHIFKVFGERKEALNFESKIITLRRKLTNDPTYYKLETKQHNWKDLPTIDLID